LLGKLAGRDALAEESRHAAAVAAAICEPLGVDERVDRLVDERPGEARVPERATRVGRDHGLEAADDRVGAARGRVHLVELVLAGGAKHLDEEIALRGEVAVERAGGDAGPLGDREDRRGGVAALLHHLARRADQARASLVGLLGAASRARLPHQRCRVAARPASSAASSSRWKWTIALSKRPNSRNSFAPLASPRWTPRETALSSAAPESTSSRPRLAASRPLGSSGRSVKPYVTKRVRSTASGSSTTITRLVGNVATIAFGKRW